MGPLVHVVLASSVPRQAALTAAGVALPAPTQGIFLIDTGASHTSVDPSLLAPLKLQPTGTIPVHTSSTNGAPVSCNQYDVELAIGAPNGLPFTVPALPVTEANLAAQGIFGLIGRDVLSRCTFIYNGVTGLYTLCY
ncbi:aspartyl protease family protein [Burkholderia sp. RF4-BP95]|uniref:aspartyl protease family protein n=1 Tax=Burkholderia sp. RF4-BP95 TaxID=1637845 RepID=UPI0009E6BC33|nr:aspartyl protease family protein [Burkholderia sp. RF4-BP95]